MRTIYFGVVFWGKKYCDDFMHYCLLSLLFDSNIPSLHKSDGHKFLVCTTERDWKSLISSPSYRKLLNYVEIVFIPLEFSDRPEAKMKSMSRGHRLISQKMYEDAVLGSFVYPDTVYSDFFVSNLIKHYDPYHYVTLAHCPRLANEGFLEQFSELVLKSPRSLSSKALLVMALENVHSETLQYEWTSAVFGYNPVMISLRARNKAGFLFHTLNWAPVLVDYKNLFHHETQTFDEWTIDGDYIYKNFPDPQKIRIVKNSDEFAMVSFTRESDLTYLPLKNQRLQLIPLLGDFFKILILRSKIQSGSFDELKLKLFEVPVRLKTNDQDAGWEELESKGLRIVRSALKPLSNIEKGLFFVLCILNDGLVIHTKFWIKNKARQLSKLINGRENNRSKNNVN